MDTTSPATFKDKKKFPILKSGMRHKAVPLIKAMLRSQGAWAGSDSEDYGPKMVAAIRYFQGTHLGPNGEYLQGDGEVGPSTWWTLYNPSGAAQKSNIKPINVVTQTTAKKVAPATDLEKEFVRRYGKMTATRQAFLRALWIEYLKPVKEIPDGSNAGPDVNKYTQGFGAVYWCALFLSWAFKQATGAYCKGKRRAGVMDWFNAAKAAGYGYTLKSGYKPRPGDLMVWKYTSGSGHISAIVAANDALTVFNTIGGNESNRVKLGKRSKANEPQLVGFINPFDDEGTVNPFITELLPVDADAALTKGGTR